MKFIVTKNFEIKDLRVSNQILRMKIFKDKKKRKIWIKQKCYIYIFYPYFNKEDDELVNTLFPTTCQSSLKQSLRTQTWRRYIICMKYNIHLQQEAQCFL